MKNTFLIGIIIMLATCCDRKEMPVPKYNRGGLTAVGINMSPTYKNQVWFSLFSNQVVSSNLKTDWDIAFEASENGWHIILNTSKSMRAAIGISASFTAVTDTAGFSLTAKPDVSSGNLDSTAIGDWRQSDKTYIIHRGFNENGRFLGFWKLTITYVNATNYEFKYADIYGTETHSGKIAKDSRYRFQTYSFSTHKQIQIEPAIGAYDLCFTQYTTVFYEPSFQYYQVTGVLTSSGVQVIKITDRPFAEIALTDTLTRSFNSNADAVGYDWKTFNLTTNTFTVTPEICYLIKDAKGFIYKLHFIDFYNDQGEKGFPKFEYLKL